MSTWETPGLTRRDLMKDAGKFAAVAAVGGAMTSGVFAAGGDTIQVALIGVGGRGRGAAENALLTKLGPTKLVAMADVFEDKLDGGLKMLSKKLPAQVDVPKERQFI